jgi:uncharacterized protein YlxP (DUF503 family)
MHILLVEYELHLPDCHSLKEKRHVIKPLLNRLRSDYNISAAETEHHDLWQSAVIAVVAVSALRESLERTEREITEMMEGHGDLQVVEVGRQWL